MPLQSALIIFLLSFCFARVYDKEVKIFPAAVTSLTNVGKVSVKGSWLMQNSVSKHNWFVGGLKKKIVAGVIWPAHLSCDEMKQRKWLRRTLFPPQCREREMGDRVWQVQKELEELQERSRGNAEVSCPRFSRSPVRPRSQLGDLLLLWNMNTCCRSLENDWEVEALHSITSAQSLLWEKAPDWWKHYCLRLTGFSPRMSSHPGEGT